MQCILDTQSNSSSKSKKLTPYGASMTHYPGGLRQPPAPSPAPQLEHASGRHSIHPRAGPTQMGWCARDAGPPRYQNRLRTIVRAMTPLLGKVGPVHGQLCCKRIPNNCRHMRQSSATAASASWVKLHSGTPRRRSPPSRLSVSLVIRSTVQQQDPS